MQGKIALEEHWILPRFLDHAVTSYALDVEKYNREIMDIDELRIQNMNDHGVQTTVLSHTGPGVQGLWDVAESQALAREANDHIAEKMKAHPGRFAAFASLSMHDPEQAAVELRRCVTELGFVGALVYNWQRAGPDGDVNIFYDSPKFDVLWAEFVALDVPLYLHPTNTTGTLFDRLYKDRPYLNGPPHGFACGVSLHVLGMVTNGVFDRFPQLQVVIGHLGEHIPFDLSRIDRWFEQVYKPQGLGETCKKTIREYFQQNLWVTTSGHFSTPTLRYVMEEIGRERIMFSTDYPYETFEAACNWWDEMPLSDEDKRIMGELNARKLLKLS